MTNTGEEQEPRPVGARDARAAIMTRRSQADHTTNTSEEWEPRRVSGLALFVPAVLVALALALSGHHSAVEITTAMVAFAGIPLVILALRHRSAHPGGLS